MKKYSKSENELRKRIFAWVAENGYRSTFFTYKGNPIPGFVERFGKGQQVSPILREAVFRHECNVEVKASRARKTKLRNWERLAECLPSSGYSMGEEKVITNRLLGEVSRVDCTQEYARSCKYSAKHGCVAVELPISILRRAENADGMITIRGKRVQTSIWKGKWLVFDTHAKYLNGNDGEVTYRFVEGYLVNLADVFGYDFHTGKVCWHGARLFHTENLKFARNILKRHLKDVAESKKYEGRYLKMKQEEEKARLKREEKRKKEIEQAKKRYAKIERKRQSVIKKLSKDKCMLDVFEHEYTYEDSINAGNCHPGTRSFAANNNLELTDKVKGSTLLRLAGRSGQTYNVENMLVGYMKNTYNNVYVMMTAYNITIKEVYKLIY